MTHFILAMVLLVPGQWYGPSSVPYYSPGNRVVVQPVVPAPTQGSYVAVDGKTVDWSTVNKEADGYRFDSVRGFWWRYRPKAYPADGVNLQSVDPASIGQIKTNDPDMGKLLGVPDSGEVKATPAQVVPAQQGDEPKVDKPVGPAAVVPFPVSPATVCTVADDDDRRCPPDRPCPYRPRPKPEPVLPEDLSIPVWWIVAGTILVVVLIRKVVR